MRKLLCVIMCLFILFSLAACFEEDIPSKDTAGSSQTEDKKEETFGLNESATFKDLKFTATEIKESEGEDFFTPESGNVFVGVKFEIENISSEEQALSSLLLFEAYADDVKCDYSINAACAFDNGTLDGDLAAGKKMVGWYAVEVNKDWKTIELEVQSSWLSNNSAKFVFEK